MNIRLKLIGNKHTPERFKVVTRRILNGTFVLRESPISPYPTRMTMYFKDGGKKWYFDFDIQYNPINEIINIELVP